ncbi:hypothetical protein U2I54_27220 [Bacillus pseudomycoides]|uniref:Uncharacterized protein n=1 Tax=Bacillus bingmayongensis TaxID=1150157 RepID=A0ABU5K4P3_9BACI|nr:hypothetical protein [Bacillus pseudomycoides]
MTIHIHTLEQGEEIIISTKAVRGDDLRKNVRNLSSGEVIQLVF